MSSDPEVRPNIDQLTSPNGPKLGDMPFQTLDTAESISH